MASDIGELKPPRRLLLGPGPSNVDPRVLKAMSTPLVGHLDPYFLQLMNETMGFLRYTFKTKNRFTLPISATGSAGMEAAVCNLVERGDEVVVCINGLFGERMKDVVERCGGKVTEVRADWGSVIDADDVEEALKKTDTKMVGIVHAETSTGALQPLETVSKIAHEHDALFLVDAVTSLGGCELDVDKLNIDICYSGTQKCLNCPPGLAPVTLNEKAMEAVRKRRSKVQSWYLDFTLLDQYWSEERVYHHTAPISMIYGLREALRIVAEEGLEKRWARHRLASQSLVAGVEALGLGMWAREHRCPSLNSVKIPNGADDTKVRKTLLNDFSIEIGGGLGTLKGKIWRVGLMGLNASEHTVVTFLSALERALNREGYRVKLGDGVKAALEVYQSRAET